MRAPVEAALRAVRRLVLVAVLCGSSPATAASPERLRVSGAGACPTAEQLIERLRPLLPDWEVALNVDSANPPSHEVEWNKGALTIDGQRQEPPAASRDCLRAAEDLAVLIALVLMPPATGTEPQASPSEAAPPSEPRDAEPKAVRQWSVWGSISVQFGSEQALALAPSGAVDLAWEGKHWGLVVGAAVSGAQEYEFSSSAAPEGVVQASQQASYLHVSFDLLWPWGPVVSAWSLGSELQLLQVQGSSLPLSETSTLWNLGGRAALQLRWPLTPHWNLAAQGVLGVYPHRYALEIADLTTGERETVGQTEVFVPRAGLALGYQW